MKTSLSKPKNWFHIAVLNLFLAACMGTVLRFAFVEEISWLKYKNLMQAHVYVALMGWVYLGLFTLIVYTLLGNKALQKKIYKLLFWGAQVSVVGMMLSYFVQSYGFFSLLFTLLHILISYVFIYQFVIDLRQHASSGSTSHLLAKTALIFLFISTLGIWALAIIIYQSMQGTLIYYMSVQFFLHFQLNGWFVFGILALFFAFLEKQQIDIPQQLFRSFYFLLLAATVLTYALAVSWSNPLPIIFWINSLGVIVQLAAAIYFVRLIFRMKVVIATFLAKRDYALFRLTFFAFLLKILVQTAVVLPYLATISYTIRNYVIGFLHLVLLGLITCFLIAYSSYQQIGPLSHKLTRLGLQIFLIGFVATELILVVQGTMFWGNMGFLPQYYAVIFGATVLLPVGLGVYAVGTFRKTEAFGKG